MTKHRELHMDSLTLHEKAPARTHSDLTRTLYRGLADLENCGIIKHQGGAWILSDGGLGRQIIAQEFSEPDSMGRYRTTLQFGSWLCLALALKVSREDVRQVLLDAVKKHPL